MAPGYLLDARESAKFTCPFRNIRIFKPQKSNFWLNTLLKSDVTSRDQVIRCRGSQECGSRFVNFACQFHWRRWHSFRITLKSTTLLFMRSSNV